MIRTTILQIFYLGFKFLVSAGFKLYYPKTIFHNRKYLDTKGPLILLGNHPNGMMDPLNVALLSKRMVHFLAKSQLFSNWFSNWFFNTFYCIPIERPDFSNGKAVNNDKNFERCNEFLFKGGCLFIAPEGTSLDVRRILPLKTGAARIALQAESLNDFHLGIKFVTSGITYIEQGSFWSGQYIVTSPPIVIADFKEIYQKDPVLAVKQLSLKLHAGLSELTIDLENDELLPYFEKMIRWFNPGIEQDPELFYLEGKRLADLINIFEKNKSVEMDEFYNAFRFLAAYEKKWKVPSAYIYTACDDHSILSSISKLIVLLVGLPLFLAGGFIHFLPNFIPWLVEKLAKQHKIYIATTKFIVGMILYLCYYPLLIYGVIKYSFDVKLAIGSILLIPVLGLIFFPYWRRFKNGKAILLSFFIAQNEKELVKGKILTFKHLIYN